MRDRSRSRDRKPAIARAAALLGPLCLLAACGDSLDDRNAAVAVDRPQTLTIQSQDASRAATIQSGQRPTSAEPTSTGFAEENEAEDVIEVDASDESFIDMAQGFSTEPLDDTSGFDPSPQGFAETGE